MCHGQKYHDRIRQGIPIEFSHGLKRLLRMSVIFRKVTGCFRSEWGDGLYADILSVMATAAIHDQNALEAIRACLKGKPILQTI